MSDRCYLTMTLLAKDLHRLRGLEELDHYDYSSPLPGSGLVVLEYDDVNYGAYNDLVELSKDFVPFEGSHSAGSDYNSCEFVSDGSGRHFEAITNNRGEIVVPLNLETLKPVRDEVAAVRAYRSAMDAFTTWKEQLETNEN